MKQTYSETVAKLKNYTCNGQLSFNDPASFNAYIEFYKNSQDTKRNAVNKV